MNKYNNLLLRISDEYSIPKGKHEEPEQWKSRLIYSLLGRMALASLFDEPDDGTTSIVHMKSRIETLLACYREMYPELSGVLTVYPKELSDEIYDIFLKTGEIYHMPNRALRAAKSEAIVGGVRFTRGYELETKQRISGIGTYLIEDQNTDSGALIDMFQLDETPLKECWKRCVQNATWTRFSVEANTEYLRMTPPFTKGYWVNRPDNSGAVSLLRTGYKGAQIYYLYRMEAGKLLASQLPQWQVEDYNYRQLANACLETLEVLPASLYRRDGELVYLKFSYLPPPAELNLWKLYSWPSSMISLPGDFNRVCVRRTFDSIRSVMQVKGYQFTEE